MLHQFDLGLLKKTWEMTLDMIKVHSTLPGGNNLSYKARLRLLDNRLMKFNTRHADVDMPREAFSNGASSIANMRAAEFVPLMWQLMIVIGAGNEDVLLSRPGKQKVVATIFLLLKVRAQIWKPEITEVDIRGITQNIGL